LSALAATDPAALQMDAVELAAWRRDGVAHAVLDVREPWELEICRLAGSIDIPLHALPDALDRLAGDVPLVAVCHHGVRSLQAVVWLRGQGFANAINLRGGVDRWAMLVDPTMRRY